MVVNQVLLLLLKPQPYVPAKTFATNCSSAGSAWQVLATVAGAQLNQLGRPMGASTCPRPTISCESNITHTISCESFGSRLQLYMLDPHNVPVCLVVST